MKKTEKIRTSFNISKSLFDKLNLIPRRDLPNKSKLVESLLENWIEKYQKNMGKKLSAMQ